MHGEHHRRVRVDRVPAATLLICEAEGVGDRVGCGLLAFTSELAHGVLGAPQRETGEHEHRYDRHGNKPADEPHRGRAANEVTTVSGHGRGPAGSRHR